MLVRGVTGVRGNYKTSDGMGWERKAFANNHQRTINGQEKLRKISAQFKVCDANGAIDPSKLAATLRSDAIFRRRFMLAINH